MRLTLCKLKEFLGVFLLLILFYLAYIIHQHRSQAREMMIEKYESYDKTVEEQKVDAIPLSATQKEEVRSIFSNMIPKEVSDYVNANKSTLKGPPGPMGQMGQSGGTFVESGFLVNKAFSYADSNKNFGNPNRVLTRATGNDPKTSLAFLDGFSPFASYQKWMLDSSNHLVNQFDQSCVAFNPALGDKEKVYLSSCTDTASLKLQKDKFNRLMLTESMGTPAPKCLALGGVEKQVLTTGLPDCKSGNDCFKVGFGKSFLKVDTCDLNVPQENEVWSFL